MDDFKPKNNEQGERMLASMYAQMSSAHRCLAIMHQRDRVGDGEGAQQMRDKADTYFDNAEELGRLVFDADVYVTRYSVDGEALARMILQASDDDFTDEGRLLALHHLADYASMMLQRCIG